MRAFAWPRAARIGLAGMAAAALAMAAAADDAKDDASSMESPSAAPVPAKPPGRAAQAKAVAHVELERLNRKAEAEAAKEAPPAAGEAQNDAPAAKPEVVNAFAGKSWYVPPPPPKVEPPPKPTAPPLPFSFMGRYEEAGRTGVVIMLVKGDRLYTVSEGDVIDDTYRVDRITERTVELTYLPLKEKQLLQIGGA